MFFDKAKLKLIAGSGGNGMIAFRHEKSIQFGGPSGGNGGKGGSIYFRATTNQNTLVEFRYMYKVHAEDGEKGAAKDAYGRSAEDIYLEVPVGTLILDEKTGKVLKDLSVEGEEFLACSGGRGGRGNSCFKSSINRTPKIGENGLPGQEREIILELKLLADVGLVGIPSVGKSTLLSVISAAKPEIAPYPFTTLVPNLGVCYLKDGSSFVVADLPGLIEGAHLGKGLGLAFLRHIERCKVIIHILDMEKEGDPLEDFKLINNELEIYKLKLMERPMIVACNKMDSEGAQEKYENVKKALEGKYDVFPITAINNEGIEKLLYRVKDVLKSTPAFPLYDEDDRELVIDAFEESGPVFEIKRQNGKFIITGSRVVRTYRLINNSTDEGVLRLTSYLRKIGVEEKLRELGINNGDIVVLEDFEFEYYD